MNVFFKEDKLFGLGTESYSLRNSWSVMTPPFLGDMLAPLPDGDPVLTPPVVPCAADTFGSALSWETEPISQQVISVSRVSEKRNSAEACNGSGIWVFNFADFSALYSKSFVQCLSWLFVCFETSARMCFPCSGVLTCTSFDKKLLYLLHIS